MNVMTITFGDDYCLEFELEPSPIADLWLSKMRQRYKWPMDDSRRFYGFDDPAIEAQAAGQQLQQLIEIINSYDKIIDREWTRVDDQDLLNYLHNIFERYHGLLDAQLSEWWSKAPSQVRQALADLNIAVHRAESVTRGRYPRFVCTWFGMPKDSWLDKDLMNNYGSLCHEFGGVYLNYVEIGKTVEDLAKDDDQYIGPDAFQPFQRYSADFSVRFYDAMADISRIYRYFQAHRHFFESRDIKSFDDFRSMPWRYKVAQLKTTSNRDEILTAISQRQHITDIYFT